MAPNQCFPQDRNQASHNHTHLTTTPINYYIPHILLLCYCSCFYMVNVSYNTAQWSSERSFFHFPHVIKCCSNSTISFILLAYSCSLTASMCMSDLSCLVTDSRHKHTQGTNFHTDFLLQAFVSHPLRSLQNIPPTS